MKLLVLLLCGVGCSVHRVRPRALELVESSEPSDRILFQTGAYGRGHAQLGPEAEGLLLPAESRWGQTMRMNSVPDLPSDNVGAQQEYYFYSGPSLPRPVWFGCKGPCPPEWTPAADPQLADGTYQRFAGFQFGPGMKNPWDLDRAVELVRIEVNGGKGGAEGGIKLVATKLESVEGHPGYPRSVASLFDGARTVFDRFVAQQATAVGAALERAARSPHGYLDEVRQDAGRFGPSEPGPEQELSYEAIVPTWLPEQRRLQLIFLRRVARIRTATARHHEGTCGTPSREVFVPVKSGYAVELGQLIELDASGALVRLHNFTPAPMSAESLFEARLVSRTAIQPPLKCPGFP